MESAPSHALTVPPVLAAGVRCVGDFTHKKLELPPYHGNAVGPLML